jgi:1-deoxyxylulose-5-phosphate synthase
METKKFRGMPNRRAGHSGLWLSAIGLGLWKWGDPAYDGARVGEHEGFAILDRALSLGVTHWDTANSYNAGAGNSERLLGRYFASRGAHVRDMVVLATKIRNTVRDEHELNRDFSPNQSGASRKYILSAVDGCLQRLQSDYIDILYHHFPNLTSDGGWESPLEETYDAFNTLIQQGKVRYLAVSNRTAQQLAEEQQALGLVAGNPARRIIAIQNPYNLLQRAKVAMTNDGDQQQEQAFFQTLREQGVGLIPLTPLGVGMLTGRYRKDQLDQDGRLASKDDAFWRDQLFTDRNFAIVEELVSLAESKQCTVAQLAITWLLANDQIPSVITGVTRMEQLEDNAAAVKVELTGEEIDRLNQWSLLP